MDEINYLKYNLVSRVTDAIDLGIAYVRDEAKIRYTIENADVTNLLRVDARLIGQAAWVTLLDVTGSDSQVVDVTTYEEIRVRVITYDSLSNHIMVYASSFDNVSGGGGGFSGDYNDLINTPTIPVINDSITNGNTTSAPSENAVFDALALKSPYITVEDEGSTLTTALSSLNFVGTGVTATNSGGDVTVTIAAGGGPTYLYGSAVIDYANIVTDNMLDFAITVTGANPGDFVVLGRPIDQDPGLVTEAFVSATAVVIVRAHNVQSVAVDQPAKLYRVLVIQYP